MNKKGKRPESDEEWAKVAEENWTDERKFTEQLRTEREIWKEEKKEKKCGVCERQGVCRIEVEGTKTKMNFLSKCKTISKSQFKLIPLYVHVAKKYFCIGREKQEMFYDPRARINVTKKLRKLNQKLWKRKGNFYQHRRNIFAQIMNLSIVDGYYP